MNDPDDRRSECAPARAGAGAAFEELWSADLARTAGDATSWLWHGYLARGNVTVLTSQWKTGKTTLLSVLLAKRVAGGEMAGLAVAAGKTAVVSEESQVHWNERSRRLDFGAHACFLCRPFRGKPTPAQWEALLDHLAGLGERHGVDLAVIDPLASFLPGRDENHAGLMLEALAPLQRLTKRGLAVLLLHHPKKGEAPAGQWARGSGALQGFADVLVEMRGYGPPGGDDRRRMLRGLSRHDETPRERLIELNAAGTDYLCLGDAASEEFRENWEALRALLTAAKGRLTRREVLALWPEDAAARSEATVRRCLEEAAARGWVRRAGAGTNESPFRYSLPEKEDDWAEDPVRELMDLVNAPVPLLPLDDQKRRRRDRS